MDFPTPIHNRRWKRVRDAWPKIILVTYLLCFVALLSLAIPVSDTTITGDYCRPDGRANPNLLGVGAVTDSNVLSGSYIFTINLAFGNYNFSRAKLIDVVWDVLVGRGGQIFLAYVTYRVLIMTLLHTMEDQPVSYQLFATLTFGNISIETMFKSCCEGFGKGFQAKLRLIGIVLAGSYVVAFPTLMSAATGYTTGWIPYVAPFANGTMVELAKFNINQTVDPWVTPDLRGTPAYLGNDIFWTKYLAQTLSCQPSSNYKWGFSYLLLFITAWLNTTWVLIVFVLWKIAERHSTLCRVGRRIGIMRGAMDMSIAIRDDIGQEADHLAGEELEERLKSSEKGIFFAPGSLKVSASCRLLTARLRHPYNAVSEEEWKI